MAEDIKDLRAERKKALTDFAKHTSTDKMLPTSSSAYRNYYGISITERDVGNDYTREQVENIINSNDINRKIKLSRWFFNHNSMYQRIIIHYATLLYYSGILIPYPGYNKSLSKGKLAKKYYDANLYIERMNTKDLFDKFSTAVLVDGSYFGLIIHLDKNVFSYIDLPIEYCQTRFKNASGVGIVEFDIRFFNKITNDEKRKRMLRYFPPEVVRAYNKYKLGKIKTVEEYWVALPTDRSLCFRFFDNFDVNIPPFLEVIPAIFDYKEAVDNEKARDQEEIRKLVVQHMPHLNDGSLLFEPDEAEVMHNGTVGMLSKNKNVDVLTSYGDVDVVTSSFTNEGVKVKLERVMRNIFERSGASAELFCSTSNLTLSSSITNDILFMMLLANKYAIFLTSITNALFANKSLTFKYKIYPASLHNQKLYLEDAYKLASSGYSFLLPATVLGMSQLELTCLKDLENNTLSLEECLIPLQSSFTQSKNSDNGDGKKAGGQEKDPSELNAKTEANQKAMDTGGGDGNG